MKNTFETKENYINFKSRWATYFNDEARHLDRNEYGNKQRKLTAFHFALYAILQGKDPLKGLSTCSAATVDMLKWQSGYVRSKQTMMEFFDITEKQTDELFKIAQEYFINNRTFKDFQNQSEELEDA